jgi:hypothetical protein
MECVKSLDGGGGTPATDGVFVLGEGHDLSKGIFQGVGGVKKIGRLGLEEEQSACWCLGETVISQCDRFMGTNFFRTTVKFAKTLARK